MPFTTLQKVATAFVDPLAKRVAEAVNAIISRLDRTPEYFLTDAEISAGVTPVDYRYPEGDVRRYGAVGDGSTDSTTAIQSAINVSAVTRGTAYLPPGIFMHSGLTIKSKVCVRGSGWHQTILRLIEGSNTDCLKTEGFDNLSVERDNLKTATPPNEFEIYDLAIDGQRGLQTLGDNGEGFGVAIFGYSYNIDNVRILNCKNFGFYSEYDDTSPPAFAEWGEGFSPFIGRINIAFCDGGAFCYRGPIDAKIDVIYAHLCGVDGTSSEANSDLEDKGTGVRFEASTDYNGTAHVNAIHSYGHVGLCLYCNTWIRGGLIEAEAGYGDLVVLDHRATTEQSSIDSLICYKPNRKDAGASTAIKISGNRYRIGALVLRGDAPDLGGSAPYETVKALEITGHYNQVNNVMVDGLEVDRVTHGVWVTGNFNRVTGIVRNCTTVGSTQAVDGSFGLYVDAISHCNIDLTIEDCAVLGRMNSATARNNVITINGAINVSPTTGQLGLVGNWPGSGTEGGLHVDPNKVKVTYYDNGVKKSNTRRFSHDVEVYDGGAITTEQTVTFDHHCPWTPREDDFVVYANFRNRTAACAIRYAAIRSITSTEATFAVKVDSADADASQHNVLFVVDMTSGT